MGKAKADAVVGFDDDAVATAEQLAVDEGAVGGDVVAVELLLGLLGAADDGAAKVLLEDELTVLCGDLGMVDDERAVRRAPDRVDAVACHAQLDAVVETREARQEGAPSGVRLHRGV